MKKYVLKYIIFFLPFLAALFVELFLLPIDFFTFRPWETLVVKDSYKILDGPFYPRMTLVKTEKEGDLRPSPACAVAKKDLLWQTDAYGYRKAASSRTRYPIIIIGDSNTVGSGLSQPDTISEVLQRRLGKDVYPLAPALPGHIFRHGLLKQHKPEVIILQSIERNIMPGHLPVPPVADFQPLSVKDRIIWSVRLHPVVQKAAIKLDRALKSNMIHFIKARINPQPARAGDNIEEETCPVLFLQSIVPRMDIPDEVRQKTVDEIKELNDLFTLKGIRFIFLPVPNKENIYHRLLGVPRPVYLEKLISELRLAGVEVADTQGEFDKITRETGTPLYHRDDTHWNTAGVEAAAALVTEILQKPAPAAKNKPLPGYQNDCPAIQNAGS